MESATYKSTRTLWWLFAAAALSLLTTLPLPYVGEEAVYTITSLEMWVNREFFLTTLYGTSYPRPPFLNWLVVPLTNLLGWEYVLQASRLVTAAATIATGVTATRLLTIGIPYSLWISIPTLTRLPAYLVILS